MVSAVLCLSAGTAHAQLLNFDFTLVGDPSIDDPSTHYFTGTITGEVVGLANNASSTPTDIILTSIPASLNGTTAPYSFKANGWNLSQFGSITVTNGSITSDLNYEAGLVSEQDSFYLDVGLNIEQPLVGTLNGIDFDGNAIANLDGFSGVTFTPAVPEPSTYALLVISFLTLIVLRRMRLPYTSRCPSSTGSRAACRGILSRIS
ncbi:MAG TPA: PEP-CTERM sorting domain-containing protein [Candidatus Methylacidiphilales bacterium]|nr:PEP-CTERM sorting domain-containing protein [Candidatus Methylacidiphilales bacterium]